MRYVLVLSLLAGMLPASTGESRPVSGQAGEDPPSRVVALAPHLAELVYTAGGGDLLVGVSAYTNYPPAARALPRIGDAFRVDMERLTGLMPDLILAWQEGTPAGLVGELRRRGFAVLAISTRSVEEVAQALRDLGEVFGTEAVAESAAREFMQALENAADAKPAADPVRVFYQIGARPIYTVSDDHYISELIRLCGGTNVFADLGALASAVSVESVLARDPELILATAEDPSVLAAWRRWDSLTAVRSGNLSLLPADTLARPTTRLARGVIDICRAIDRARHRLAGDK